MRLLICGSREWFGSWEDIAIHLPEEPCTIIHGARSRIDGRGVQVSVDMIADFAARQCGHDVCKFPVDRATDGRWPAASPSHNARMLRDGCPTHGLAFGALVRPAGKSLMAGLRATDTGNMVGLMLAARLPVRWVPSPGSDARDLAPMPEPTSPQEELSRSLNGILGPT